MNLVSRQEGVMRKRIPVFLTLAAGLGIGCASSPGSPAPPVSVGGGKKDVATLVGRWVGEYSSQATGRSGSIVFELTSGEKEAHGDVLMIPKGSDRPLSPEHEGSNEEELRRMPQVLEIRFVNAEAGAVSGTLDPYRDPDCNCRVETTFVGAVSGDTIQGTFTSVTANGTRSAGQWKVARKKS
jgi:hypothetical protein